MKNLGTCQVCHREESKYCCPKCQTNSCSLLCSRKHKKEAECDGKRDPVKFISLQDFDESSLLNDYRLLEAAGRVVESCATDPMKKYTRYREVLPVHLNRLRSAVFQRGCRLKYVPQHFVRHSKNTTLYKWDTRIISWKVEWHFEQAGVMKVTDCLPEHTRLAVGAWSHIQSDPSLLFYKAAGFRRTRILLRAEQQKGKRRRFFDCDPSRTLRGNLEGMTILEYPIFHVVLEDHIQAYKILPRPEDLQDDLGIRGILESEESASDPSEDSSSSSSEDSSSEDSDDEVSVLKPQQASPTGNKADHHNNPQSKTEEQNGLLSQNLPPSRSVLDEVNVKVEKEEENKGSKTEKPTEVIKREPESPVGNPASKRIKCEKVSFGNHSIDMTENKVIVNMERDQEENMEVHSSMFTDFKIKKAMIPQPAPSVSLDSSSLSLVSYDYTDSEDSE